MRWLSRRQPREEAEMDKGQGTQRMSPQLRDALASGFGAGLFGGAAAHFLAGGKMTFPIFLVISIIMFTGIKG
ncbi:MAG: hypothetical protein QME66_12575 [Candidatus Eisenbacteria bacterium]|nr:hypothetical protein [Candidatus Eisenbacteria bacterium]